MATLNYAEAYKQALANAYPKVLHFAALFGTPNNAVYKTVDAKTIKIPTLTTTGRKDADRDTIAAAARNYDNAWEPKVLSHQRYWSTLLHPMDIDQTNMVATIQNITRTFNEQQKFPEKDSYLISKIYADWIAQSKTADTTALTTDNVLAKFDAAMEDMDEANVPASGRILYVTPAIKTIIKNAKEIQRYLNATDTVINRAMTRIDEVTIESVPSAQMKTVYDFTTGCVAGAGAKQINMLLIHPTAVLTPESYSFVGFDEPSAKTGGKFLYYEESFEDVFILNKRTDAIKFFTEA